MTRSQEIDVTENSLVGELKKHIGAGRIRFQQERHTDHLLGMEINGVTVTEDLQVLVLELSKLSPRPITITSVIRGGRGHHSLGRAVDLNEDVAPVLLPLIGTPDPVERLSIDEFIFDAGTVGKTNRNLWNFDRGKPHSYGETTLAQHRNHIHFSVRHRG